MDTDESRWLKLERRPRETLRAALERTLRQAILSGALRPGVRLPSSRLLAAQFQVSRGVATEAYAQLVAQGFVVARTKAAPVVADLAPPAHAAQPRPPAPRPPRYDFSPTTPDVTLF